MSEPICLERGVHWEDCYCCDLLLRKDKKIQTVKYIIVNNKQTHRDILNIPECEQWCYISVSLKTSSV